MTLSDLTRWSVAFTVTCGMAVATMVGCAPSGSGRLTVRSVGDEPARLHGDFRTAIYRYDDRNSATLVLSDLAIDDLEAGRFGAGQVVAIDLVWVPKAGETPMDDTATNGVVRHLVIAGEAVGLYGGAGYIRPGSKPGGEWFGGRVDEATLDLLDSTDDFVDRLGTAWVEGGFRARRDDEVVDRIALQINSFATRKLGEITYVVSD